MRSRFARSTVPEEKLINLNDIFLTWNTKSPKRFEQVCRYIYMKGKPFVNRRHNTKRGTFSSQLVYKRLRRCTSGWKLPRSKFVKPPPQPRTQIRPQLISRSSERILIWCFCGTKEEIFRDHGRLQISWKFYEGHLGRETGLLSTRFHSRDFFRKSWTRIRNQWLPLVWDNRELNQDVFKRRQEPIVHNPEWVTSMYLCHGVFSKLFLEQF